MAFRYPGNEPTQTVRTPEAPSTFWSDLASIGLGIGGAVGGFALAGPAGAGVGAASAAQIAGIGAGFGIGSQVGSMAGGWMDPDMAYSEEEVPIHMGPTAEEMARMQARYQPAQLDLMRREFAQQQPYTPFQAPDFDFGSFRPQQLPAQGSGGGMYPGMYT